MFRRKTIVYCFWTQQSNFRFNITIAFVKSKTVTVRRALFQGYKWLIQGIQLHRRTQALGNLMGRCTIHRQPGWTQQLRLYWISSVRPCRWLSYDVQNRREMNLWFLKISTFHYRPFLSWCKCFYWICYKVSHIDLHLHLQETQVGNLILIHDATLYDNLIWGIVCYKCDRIIQTHLLFGHNKFRKIHWTYFRTILRKSQRWRKGIPVLRASRCGCL